MRSPKLAASLSAAAATKASDAERAERNEEQHQRPASPEPSVSASGAQTPEPKTPSASASSSSQIALDEELSKQAFVAEAMATMQSDEEDDDSDAMPDHEEWFGPMLHVLELQEMWGDGLPALLQHLSTSRQPSLQVWHQLKLEVESNNDAPATWTNLSMLEEDFVLINHEHLHSSGLGSRHATVGAVH